MTLASMPGFQRAYAKGPYGQIHYHDSGGPGMPLLLLHQSPASSSDWFALAPYLKDANMRVMAMDTPGMGLSDPLPHAPTIEEYADAVPAVLDHAGVAHTHLLGHHTGVQIAIEAAVRHPDRVRSAMLFGVPVMSIAEQEDYWRRIVPNEMEGALHKPISGGAHLTDHFSRVERVFGVMAAHRMVISALLAGPLWWHGHNAALRHNMVPALLAATQPLLLISHPGEMLEANTREASMLRPDAEHVSLAINGPMAMDDNPAALAEAVIKFLDRFNARHPADNRPSTSNGSPNL